MGFIDNKSFKSQVCDYYFEKLDVLLELRLLAIYRVKQSITVGFRCNDVCDLHH